MSIREDLEEVENKIEKTSVAMEILKLSKEQVEPLEKTNKRLIGVLIFVLILWVITIFGFLYYINTIGYEENYDYKYAETSDSGNACAGDNCNNGEINYGESNIDKEN